MAQREDLSWSNMSDFSFAEIYKKHDNKIVDVTKLRET